MSAANADTIRILVATDNHVGFEERDPIRKDDAWITFDEIMRLAKAQDVDMVLLGGDLFHENKPSRKAMYQVMRSLRKNCLGMKPCELEFLSDAHEVFEGAFSHVNYQDPDINISIPVFSIHGNHDDPTGDGHYCSLDLLQVAGLVNYFGRVPEADNIHVKPILLQKGKTKLALYGLSNVRDERMYRTFRDNKVKFYRPNQQRTDFFNLMTVHQNHYAHTPTSYLPENMLPDWMDLIVWGHEHECRIEPRENPQTGFHVMQPGSSVATSLVPGEAVPKHVALLSVTGTDFKVNKLPLTSVRPFITREVVLQNDKRFKGLDKKKENRHEVTKRLMQIVEEMIEEAGNEWYAVQEEAGVEIDPDESKPPPPLIRLKVEYTASDGGNFEVENPQRFSNRFAGRVANVNDVVYFYRKKKGLKRVKSGVDRVEEMLEHLEAVDAIQVETIVRDLLAAQSLKVLPQMPFGDAVNQYVNKDDKHAMETFVFDSLTTQVKDLLALSGGEDKTTLDDQMQLIKKRLEEKFIAGQRRFGARRIKEKPNEWDSDLEGHWEDRHEAWEQSAPPPTETPNAEGRRRSNAPAKSKFVQDDGDESEELFVSDLPDDMTPEPVAKRSATKRWTAVSTTKMTKAATIKNASVKKIAPSTTRKTYPRGARKNANAFVGSDEVAEEEPDVVVDEKDDDFETVDVLPVKKQAPASAPKRGRSTRMAAIAKLRQSTLNFSQAPSQSQWAGLGKSQQTALEISDDEISEEDTFQVAVPKMGARRR